MIKNLLNFPCLTIKIFLKALTISFITTQTISAQIPPKSEIDINELIQYLFPVQSEDSNPEELFEHYIQLLNNPININKATSDDLLALMLLTTEQVGEILNYRAQTGPLVSLYELQSLPSWDLALIRRIRPFLTIESKSISLKKSLSSPTQHFLLLRADRVLETARGFSELDPNSNATTRYRGDPWHLYSRYRYAKQGVYSIGFTLEKDAGETIAWTPSNRTYLADFSSFHLHISNRKVIKQLVVGDYQLQIGQGVLFSSGFTLGKGSEVITSTIRSNLGIRPYTSVTEHSFFRGIATTIAVNDRWLVTPFYSNTKRTATIAAKGVSFDSPVITSFPTDGFHRTPTEYNKKANTNERNLGLTQTYRYNNQLTMGLSILHTNYETPIEKRNLDYNRYEFKGTNNLIVSANFTYRTKSNVLFNETARSQSGGIGSILGLITSLNKRLDWSILVRYYSKDFHTLYGNPFKESSRAINELGLYNGIRFAPSKKWEYSGYIDVFKFPWKKFSVDTTSHGFGGLAQIRWRPSKRFFSYVFYQIEEKQSNNPDNKAPKVPLITTSRQVVALNTVWEKPNFIRFKTRVQATIYKHKGYSKSVGYSAFQDIVWKTKRLETSLRLTYFNAEDYDSRQYTYEKDVLYAFSLPSFYNNGTRHYVMLRYQLTQKIKVWARYAQTRYSNIDVISSGLNQINSNKRSDFKTQIIYQF